MMTPDDLIQSLLTLWDELPELVGPAWPELLPRLAGVVARLTESSDESVRESLAADVVALLRPFAAVRRKMMTTIAPGEAAPSLPRGLNPPVPAAPIPPAPAAPIPHAPATPQLLGSDQAIAPPSAEKPAPSAAARLQGQLREVWGRTFPAANLNDAMQRGRVANVSILRTDSPAALPAATCLAANREYRLRFDIGLLSPESVVDEPVPFPSDKLPSSDAGHWLDVVASSAEFKIPEPAAHVFLPVKGSSWVCSCTPHGPHHCAPSDRSPYLFLSLRSPGESREARLRIGIYFANNLVQSQLLTARIEDTERSGAGHHSRTDYTLTSFLADVSFLPQRAFHVLTNDSPEGSHSLVIKGEGQGVLALQLTEGQMRSAMQAARQFLRDAHIEETKGLFGGKNLRSLLDSNNAKDKPQFVADLKQLASLGFELWAMLFENQSKWWPLLRKPGTIQVSRTGGSRFVFPWAMVYDLPLEPGDPAKYQECRLLKEWEHAANGLDGHSRSCPFEAEHDLNTICPFGFWGFKHVIEQPPSMPEGRNLPLDIRVLSPPPRLIAGLSRKLNAATTKNHLEHLAPVVECDSLASVRTNLSPDVEIVYFYVHGKRKDLPGASEPGAVLELGEGESFEPHHLVAWRSYGWPEKHWQDVSPLVFINGCHTAEITPESLLSFVDSFSAACAAGVIGTEIALEQRLASEVAERFFAHFRANEGVGDAMQATRIELLRKGNLLGLAYTPYCSAALRLS